MAHPFLLNDLYRNAGSVQRLRALCVLNFASFVVKNTSHGEVRKDHRQWLSINSLYQIYQQFGQKLMQKYRLGFGQAAERPFLEQVPLFFEVPADIVPFTREEYPR